MTYRQDLLELIRTARHIVALTGAGISAESGIPTFRQAQTGLWAQYNPQELATPQAFLQNPRLVISDPPPAPLPQLALTVEDDAVYVSEG